jgi:penicillin-binding protein 1A
VTRATTDSDNTVFAQLAQDRTVPKVSAPAPAMGITSKLTDYPSEALGAVSVSPLEMADAYATIASGGVHHPPTAITKVVFPDGSVVNMGSPAGNRVFSEGESYAATQVLKTVIQSGTGTAANYGCPAAGKTGTTDDYSDAWFVGYVPGVVSGVWVGFDRKQKIGPGMTGAAAALPVWVDVMLAATKNRPPQDFPVPSGVVSRLICTETGLLANPACPSTELELFREGSEPTGYCNVHTGTAKPPAETPDFHETDTEAPPDERLRL